MDIMTLTAIAAVLFLLAAFIAAAMRKPESANAFIVGTVGCVIAVVGQSIGVL